MVTVLLVEDDEAISRSLTQSLNDLEYTVLASKEGLPAIEMVLHRDVDLMLLDLGLPDIEGSTLLSVVRSLTAVPVIVVTAQVSQDEAVRLLNLGADDYVTKPFSVSQLDARIRAVLRRSSPAEVPSVTVGALHIDPDRRRVTLDGEVVDLRNLEYQLLLLLAMNHGHVMSAADLTQRLWGESTADALSRLDTQLSSLRAKLGESARHPRYLQRVRGVGIRLVAPTS